MRQQFASPRPAPERAIRATFVTELLEMSSRVSCPIRTEIGDRDSMVYVV